MADYTGKSAITLAPNGEGSSGTYYKEVKWSNGFFFDGSSEKVEYVTNSDHRNPIFSVDIKITSNKVLSATFHSTAGGYFGYRVGIQAWDSSHENDVAMVSTADYAGQKDNLDGNGNWRWNGADQDVEISMNISKLQLPIYLRLVCAGCDSAKYINLHGYAFYSNSPVYDGTKAGGGYKIIQGHTHIDTPKAPVITKVSGKTITVQCDPSDSAANNTGMVQDTDSNDWKNSGYTFTYNKGVTKQFRARRKCDSDCTNSSDEQWFKSDSTTTGRTWNISGGCTALSTNSLTFNVQHYPGYDGVNEIPANSVKIKGALYTEVSDRSRYTNAIGDIKTADSSNNFTFTNLNPDFNYYFRAWSENITDANGVLDNFIDIDATTNGMFAVSSWYAYPSATTIGAHAFWNSNGSSGTKCIVSCNNKTMVITSSGGGVGFTGLSPGSTYLVTFTFSDNAGNTVVKEVAVTTYKLSITSITSSSQAIAIYPHANFSNNVIRSAIYSEDGSTIIKDWQNSKPDNKKIFNKLTHNTKYTCKLEIMDCYAYNAAGIQTDTNDSTISKSISTLNLLLSVNVKYIYQTQLISEARAYVEEDPTKPESVRTIRYKDPIDGTAFYYFNLTTLVEPGGGEYRTEGITERRVGNTTGRYEYNNAWIYSNNLPYSYCRYRVVVMLSDGFNIVTSTATSHTEFPYCRIFVDNKWCQAVPYIYTNGKWEKAEVLIHNYGAFRECNGIMHDD